LYYTDTVGKTNQNNKNSDNNASQNHQVYMYHINNRFRNEILLSLGINNLDINSIWLFCILFISTAIDISLANLKLGAQLGWIRANIQNNQIEWNWCQDCSTATEVSGANLKVSAGWIQDFKLGEGAHLKKLRRTEGGAKNFGVFRVKNHDFTPKNFFFFQF
jgi:hypothetical protein